ncbi:NUT family member 2G [Myotis lucifugus]|uniref:NUT family member 2G n=1 Tax=Myotis lucifugus TaxID=59463 RepID=UPI0003C49C07|nr:NUT family member 2G [Myotis lucifugus]
MASVGASAVLGADVTLKPGASFTPFTAQPFPPPTTGPAHRPPGEQHLPPLRTPSFPPGRPLVLPALPRTPLVAGDAGQGPVGPGACNIMDQVRSEGGRPQPSQTQTIVLTQAPPNWNAPGTTCGGAVCPAPLFLEASAVETIMPASAFGGTQASDGGWCPGLPPQAPPPAAQLAPIVPSVNAGAPRKGVLATSQSKTSPDDSCNPNSVYKNFRRWQRFKALARRHLPQSPDAEALSCFLIPVLRSLSRLRPTMTLEEGMWRAMQEWQRKSNFDRMIYYEMAEKFMEFEAEEQMQIQKLELKKGAHTQPTPAPPRPDPRGPPAPVVGGQPARTPRKALPSAQHIRRHQRPQETKSPSEIPPEVVREYMDIMDNLLGLPHSATEAPGGGWEDEVKEWLQDEGLLSYLDQLCSQEDFVTQVEAVIHPQFMEQIISPDTQQDPLALAEELEQEEGLTAAQLVEKRLLTSKEGGVQAPPSHSAPLLNSSSSESEIGQDAQRRDRGPQLGVSDKAWPPETDFKDQQRQSCSAVTLAIALLSQETGHTECAPTAGVNLQVRLSTQRARSGVSGTATKPVGPEAETKDGRGAGLLPEQVAGLPWGRAQVPVCHEDHTADRGFAGCLCLQKAEGKSLHQERHGKHLMAEHCCGAGHSAGHEGTDLDT